MTSFSIHDLETFSEIKKHTIRIWEQRYGLLQPKRSAGQQRVYTPQELDRLLTATRLQQEGFRISRIAKLLEEKQKVNATHLPAQFLKSVHDLIIAMAEMDLRQFENVLHFSLSTWGVDAALQQVIVPFCDRVGLLGDTNNKGYLQNVTLAKEAIKHKLYAAIDQIAVLEKPSGTAFLFHLGSEGNEIGMLYLQYLLRKRGFYTFYLDKQITTDELFLLMDCQQPEHLIALSSEGKQQRSVMPKFVNKLCTLDVQPKLLSIGKPLLQSGKFQHYSHVDTILKAAETLYREQNN